MMGVSVKRRVRMGRGSETTGLGGHCVIITWFPFLGR
jgi:hypothetical protein